MLQGTNIIRSMSEEELLKNIDSFLHFGGLYRENITMRERKRGLKEMIKRLDADNAYIEFCLSNESEPKKLESYYERMRASNELKKEILIYISCLPKEERRLLRWKH